MVSSIFTCPPRASPRLRERRCEGVLILFWAFGYLWIFSFLQPSCSLFILTDFTIMFHVGLPLASRGFVGTGSLTPLFLAPPPQNRPAIAVHCRTSTRSFIKWDRVKSCAPFFGFHRRPSRTRSPADTNSIVSTIFLKKERGDGLSLVILPLTPPLPGYNYPSAHYFFVL